MPPKPSSKFIQIPKPPKLGRLKQTDSAPPKPTAQALFDPNHAPQLVEELAVCLGHYADNLNLSESPLAMWQVVRGQLKLIPPPTVDEIGSAMRRALSQLIDTLRLTGPETTLHRHYVIADKLYRQGEKPSEIYNNVLMISKSQFYRERAETLEVLAARLRQMETRALEELRAETVKRLDMLPLPTTGKLIGIQFLIDELLHLLANPTDHNLIVLDGLGGLGKTAIARYAAEQTWVSGSFGALAWVSGQADPANWSSPQRPKHLPLNLDSFYDLVLYQLRQMVMQPDQIFEQMATTASIDQPTLTDFLAHVDERLQQESKRQQASAWHSDPRFRELLGLLWAKPALIVLDGLEAVPDPAPILEVLREAVARSEAKVILTSRYRLERYQHAHTIHMTELAQPSGEVLVYHYAKERGIKSISKLQQDPSPNAGSEIARIVEAAGSNPLAIRAFVDEVDALPLNQVYQDFVTMGKLSAGVYHHIYAAAWARLDEEERKLMLALVRIKSAFITYDHILAATKMRPETLNHALKTLAHSALVHVRENLTPDYWFSTLTKQFIMAQAATSNSNE
jgi:hypothetical protein